MTDPDHTAALIRGVCPVAGTVFSDGGAVDTAGFAALLRHTLRTGVSAVMFPGYASEFHKLADSERATLVELLLEQTRGRDDVAAIVAVSDHATVLAVGAAQRAAEQGADAVNLLPPYLLGPSASDVVAHIAAVLDAVAPVPVIVQYAPAQTGTVLDARTLLMLRESHPNLRFVKVEASVPGRMVEALSVPEPALPCLVGNAGLHLPDAVRRGAAGVQPGPGFVEIYLEVWRLYEQGRGDEADDLHRRMLPYLTYWMQNIELTIAAHKLVLFERGLIASAYTRRPGWTLDAAERAAVSRFLAEFADLLPPA